MAKNAKKIILISSLSFLVLALFAGAAYIIGRLLNQNTGPAKQDMPIVQESVKTTEAASNTEDESPARTTAADSSSGPEDSEADLAPATNQAPVIARILVNDDEHETSVESIQDIGRIPTFILIDSYDPEGEALTYSINTSGGIILSFETFETAAFLVYGSEDIGNYQIEFRITDTYGNETVKILDVFIEEIALEFLTGADPALCGHIVKDTMVSHDEQVLVGDNGAGRQVKGYISFDIRDPTSSGAEVLRAGINSAANIISGDLSFANGLVVKAYDYGSSLALGDFAVGGTDLVSFPIERMDQTTFTNPELLDAVNESISSGKSHFQIKLGFDVPADGDGAMDGIWIDRNDLRLRCQYRIP